MTIKLRNAVKLAGDVTKIEGTTVTIKTVQARLSGEYSDEHTVEIPDQSVVNTLKVGKKVLLMGRLERTAGKYSTRVVADVATVTTKGIPGYINIAVISGQIPMTAQVLPAVDGKVGIANLAIEFAGKIFNGVAFRQLATMYGRVWRRGAVGQLMGRLRQREFIDNNGDTCRAVEIVVEDQYETRVLKPAEAADQFGDYGIAGAFEEDEPQTAKPKGRAIPAF